MLHIKMCYFGKEDTFVEKINSLSANWFTLPKLSNQLFFLIQSLLYQKNNNKILRSREKLQLIIRNNTMLAIFLH